MSTIAKRYKYFFFSREQYEMRKNVEAGRNKEYVPGKVMNRGRWRDYTEICESPSSVYSDAVLVAEGYIENIKYQPERTDWRMR